MEKVFCVMTKYEDDEHFSTLAAAIKKAEGFLKEGSDDQEVWVRVATVESSSTFKTKKEGWFK